MTYYNNRTYYRRFTWIGNKLTDDDMKELYTLKLSTGKTITQLVAEAVRQYITREKNSVSRFNCDCC